jgi:hypothetical protein
MNLACHAVKQCLEKRQGYMGISTVMQRHVLAENKAGVGLRKAFAINRTFMGFLE